MTGRRVRGLSAGAALAIWMVATACGDGPAGYGGGLPLRPSDGLLNDPGLQDVVDRQVVRDGAMLRILLTDARADVRARAALGLASVQDPAAEDALLELVAHDPDEQVRRDAAFAVGQLRLASSVPALEQALATEPSAMVRARILEALGKIPAREASEAIRTAELDAGDEVARTWALAVNGAVQGVVTPEAQNALLARLSASRAEVREAAAYYFGRLDDPAPWVGSADALRRALDAAAPDGPETMHLVIALGRLRSPGDVPTFTELSREAPDWRVRVEAVTALGAMAAGGGESLREALMAALDDPSPHVRQRGAEALGTLALPPSVLGRIEAWLDAHRDEPSVVKTPLLGLLARHDEREFLFGWWRQAATAADSVTVLDAMAELRGNDALERILEATSRGSDAVRTAAYRALGRRWEVDEIRTDLHPVYFRAFASGLTSGLPEAEFAVMQRLTHPAFVEMGSARLLVEQYRQKLDGGHYRDAAEALRLVAFVGAPEAEGLLRDALVHPAAVLRRIAASGLERVTGEKVDVDVTTDAEEVRRGRTELPYDPTVIDWSYLAGLGSAPRLHFETERGSFTVRMVPEEAPHTVQTMARLAEEGRFDGTPFHRVVANFVVQGGDVESGTGRGGPGFQITSEFNELPYLRGAVGMASAGKDTEGSQFFIAHRRLPHLDGRYTVFGWVEEGMDTVDRIVRGDRVLSVRLERD